MSCGVSPGSSRLPESVLIDQFRCLPLPLMPWKGFSCSRQTRRDPLQRRHGELLMVGGLVGVLEDRRHLVLARGDLVVARGDGHTQTVELELDLVHALEHARGNRAEVVVVELLALGRLGPEQRPTGSLQVGASVEELLVHEEELLLRTAGGGHGRGRRAEEPERAARLLIDGLHGAQQRRLLVECVTRPRREGGRDAEVRAAGALHDERRRRGIPRGVAAGLERGAQAAGGKRRRVGLALYELLAAELGDGAAVAGRLEEGVVLLRRAARERLEPVRVVRGPLLERPLLHGTRHRVGHGRVELGAVADGGEKRFVLRARHPGLHLVEAEEVLAEDLLQIRAVTLLRRRRRIVLGGGEGIEAGDDSAHGRGWLPWDGGSGTEAHGATGWPQGPGVAYLH